MKTDRVSNVTYSSNVYVFTGGNKILDTTFMAHVVDPGAIRELAEHNRRYIGTTGLNGSHQTIYENSLPCAYGNGDYTHGSVLENSEIICVNKCEHTSCVQYPKCSAKSDFRKIERPSEATFEFDKITPSVTEYIHFETDQNDKETLKIPKIFQAPKLEKKIVVTEVEETIKRHNTAQIWAVRPHTRRLPSGKLTNVRGHYRGHDAPFTSEIVVRRIVNEVPQKHVCKDKERLRAAVEWVRRRRTPVDIPQTYQLKNIQHIESAEKIISSDIKSRILVNAGPGTGKTHTVIERLKYLARQEEEIFPDNVFVLCFSRSAVRVINDRLAAAIRSRDIPLAAKQFNIATFDSFATWFLRESEPDFDLSRLNYDERIERFIRVFSKNPADLQATMGYLIIDEVQDLVGVRARLVKTLLEHIEQGFLLLGDECQAIYDYQITDPNELNAAKLYEWVESHFGQELQEYELTRNHRNEDTIGNNLKPLRAAMLFRSFVEQKSVTQQLFDKYAHKMSTDKILECWEGTDETKAILSWSNGDAYRQSSDLYLLPDKSFTHKILTGARRLSYRREIADILSGYTNNIITFSRFIERARQNGVSDSVATQIWDGFAKVLDEENVPEIELKRLRDIMISERRVADVLLCPEDASITISTIHKAKGKEYDRVLVNYSGEISKSEDIKVYYVAMTRAKKQLVIKQRTRSHKDRRMESGRCVEINYGRIKRIELGIDGDIDPIGFIAGEGAAERQEYIATKVMRGDPITISKREGKYYIVHEGRYIGEVRPEIFGDWQHREPYQTSLHTYSFKEFTDYVELFVSDVVTIVNIRLDSRMADEYKKCGFWYGVEFCGYAKPMEE